MLRIFYTVEPSVPACSIFAVGPFHFEDTLGEDDSINLANNIHFFSLVVFVVSYFNA